MCGVCHSPGRVRRRGRRPKTPAATHRRRGSCRIRGPFRGSPAPPRKGRGGSPHAGRIRIDQPPDCQRGCGPSGFPVGPALAPGQGAKPSADGPAPRPGGEGGTRDADPPRLAGAGGFVSDRSRRHARGGRRPGGGSVARGKEDLNRGRSRLQEESRFVEKKELRLVAGLSGPTRGDGVRASPRVSRRRRRAVDGRRRRPGGNPRDPALPAWFSKYP